MTCRCDCDQHRWLCLVPVADNDWSTWGPALLTVSGLDLAKVILSVRLSRCIEYGHHTHTKNGRFGSDRVGSVRVGSVLSGRVGCCRVELLAGKTTSS